MNTATDTAAPPTNEQLAVILRLTDQQQRILARAEEIVAEAEVFTVDCQEVAEMANAELRGTKIKLKEIKAMREDFVSPAKAILASALKWFKPTIDAYERKEEILKAKLVAWKQAEDKRVEDQRREQEAEARRIREEADRTAAAERAKAAEVERKARAEAEAAERRRLEAQAAAEAARKAGDKEAAAAAERRACSAAVEQAKREEQGRQARLEGERKAQEAQLAANAKAEAAQQPVAAASVPEGFGTAANWIVELTAPCEADVIKAIAGQLAERPELVAVLKLDWVALRRQGTALKQHFNIPGLRCVNRPKAVSRSL
jgi:hypothetical protein